MSLMYNINSKGPNFDPCGIPAFTLATSEIIPSTTVIWYISLRYDCKSERQLFVTDACSNLAIRPECQTFSNGPSTSAKAAWQVSPFCQADLIWCTMYRSD